MTVLSYLCRRFLITSQRWWILFWIGNIPFSAFAKSSEGPKVSVEEAGGATIVGKKAPSPHQKVKRRRYEARLLAPIPANFLGGVLMAKADFFKEERFFSGNSATPDDSQIKSSAVKGLGGVYLPHAAEGAPRLYLVAARYDALSLKSPVKPMSEFVIGANLDDDDTPFELRFDPSDESESRALVRYRQFPGHNRWLFVLGHKIKRRSGLSLELTVPTDACLGWETPTGSWKIYGAGRLIGREYPAAFGTSDSLQKGWIEGYATVALLGLSVAVARPLYVTIEAGAQREKLTFYDEFGRTLDAFSVKFAPWGRLALETYL